MPTIEKTEKKKIAAAGRYAKGGAKMVAQTSAQAEALVSSGWVFEADLETALADIAKKTEAKAKIEADAQTKADAEIAAAAKAKAEAEIAESARLKAQAEAEAKAKFEAEVEARVRAETEAKSADEAKAKANQAK